MRRNSWILGFLPFLISMKKWENLECLGDDCSGLSVYFLLVWGLGEQFLKAVKVCRD